MESFHKRQQINSQFLKFVHYFHFIVKGDDKKGMDTKHYSLTFWYYLSTIMPTIILYAATYASKNGLQPSIKKFPEIFFL